MSRIKESFKNKKPLITYISGGDPDLDFTEKMIYQLQDSGVDILEIGIPFSDPLADGPTIQAASQRAIRGGITLEKLIKKLAEIRDEIEIPVILMGYYNSILNFGEKRFAHDAKAAGISGIIIPDLPFDEDETISEQLKEAAIDQIRLVTPNTATSRIKAIADRSSGFLYSIAHLGITGDSSRENPALKSYLTRVREQAGELPIGLGFGIDSPEKAKKAARHADGIIIGSALIEKIQAGQTEEARLNNADSFVKSIKAVLV
ncbi:tryptophan synthase subunit alpha [Halanaerobiaceae bacterium Z-7014]|uniref:Tryptophan synthase alpha chain n=1 Tax=Halonatronomonas betaini TaxID=2778430 RepID=A0A931F6T2_9FIRM|nr:tryptophan synthase subunit alpha [Halonatronomonas betaini]MBF8437260.1 tryptophan synthase subunit alpha [Halonatronomonas betaini]